MDVKSDAAGRFVLSAGLFSELCSLGLLNRNAFLVCRFNKDPTGRDRRRTGARRDDASFRHLSVPVILRHRIWSLELAKANYLGQTISISKYSQRIAFHYWHAGQAEKLQSTQRDRGKRKQPDLEAASADTGKTKPLVPYKQTHLCTFPQTV